MGPGRPIESDGGVRGPGGDSGDSDPNDNEGVGGVGGAYIVVVLEKRTCFVGISLEEDEFFVLKLRGPRFICEFSSTCGSSLYRLLASHN